MISFARWEGRKKLKYNVNYPEYTEAYLSSLSPGDIFVKGNMAFIVAKDLPFPVSLNLDSVVVVRLDTGDIHGIDRHELVRIPKKYSLEVNL